MSTYNKKVARGATFSWRATLYNSDRTAYDLTGKTVKMRIGEEGGSSLLEVTATVSSPTTGVATCTLTGAQTATLPVGVHDFHIGIYETVGTVPLHRPIDGTLEVEAVVGGTL